MFFSIIMPTYKTKIDVIKRAVNSVFAQTYNNWELIIVDDNMKESDYKMSTLEYSKYISSPKVKIIFHDNNKGANAARNTGIKNSQGKYIAFLDSDDKWDSDLLEYAYSLIKQKHGDIVSLGYRIVTKEGIYNASLINEEDGNKYSKLIFEDCVGPTSAVIVKKESLIAAGLFDEHLPARQDYDMWIRISKNHGIVTYIREPKLSIYRVGEESISMRGLNTIKGTEIVLDKILQDSSLADKVPEIKYCHYMQCGRNAASLLKYDIAKKYFRMAFMSKKTLNCSFFLILSHFPSLYNKVRICYRKNRIRKFKESN